MNSKNSLTLSKEANEIRTNYLSKYGNNDLKVMFPAMKQSEVAQNAENCYMGDYPTLKTAEIAIGRPKVMGWLMAQIGYVNEIVGPDKAMSPQQVLDMANTIIAEYYFLKFTEIMLFFHRLKAGYYGKFYGSVDSLQIMVSLRDFMQQRTLECESIERRIRQEERENKKELTLSRAEYLALKARAEQGDEEAKRILNL